jgi:hypothetical protein
MSRTAAKLSVSVPLALAKTVRKRVGSRGLSGFVARAMQHEIEREQLGAYLTELDATSGPLSKATVEQARHAWHRA